MKKILFVLIVIISIPLINYVYGQANFRDYGIQKCLTLAEYQKKYTGQVVIYLPNEDRTSSFSDYYDKKFSGKFNKKYIINEIKGNDNEMTLYLQEKEGKNKTKMNINNHEFDPHRDHLLGKKYRITDSYSVPLFLIEKFINDKARYIGRKFFNDKVIASYECIDLIMKTKKNANTIYTPYPTIHYILRNSITGQEKVCSAENAKTECFEEDLSGKYITSLFKVEKPIDESIRYGETKSIEIEGVTKYSYVDNFIDILIFGNQTKFYITLTNISQNTLKLVWNEAVYVDYNGITSKVMHVGTKYSDREAYQPSTILIKGAKIEDVAIPTCYARYSDWLKDWVIDSMYPTTPAMNPCEMRLMLPIQVKDVVNEYVFVFKVDWIFKHPELIKKNT